VSPGGSPRRTQRRSGGTRGPCASRAPYARADRARLDWRRCYRSASKRARACVPWCYPSPSWVVVASQRLLIASFNFARP
jgi:hypothetical protein